MTPPKRRKQIRAQRTFCHICPELHLRWHYETINLQFAGKDGVTNVVPLTVRRVVLKDHSLGVVVLQYERLEEIVNKSRNREGK